MLAAEGVRTSEVAACVSVRKKCNGVAHVSSVYQLQANLSPGPLPGTSRSSAHRLAHREVAGSLVSVAVSEIGLGTSQQDSVSCRLAADIGPASSYSSHDVVLGSHGAAAAGLMPHTGLSSPSKLERQTASAALASAGARACSYQFVGESIHFACT